MTAATLPVVLASVTESCEVCEDGWAAVHWLACDVVVVMPCPHCVGWQLVEMGER